jgi:hypothetical protein
MLDDTYLTFGVDTLLAAMPAASALHDSDRIDFDPGGGVSVDPPFEPWKPVRRVGGALAPMHDCVASHQSRGACASAVPSTGPLASGRLTGHCTPSRQGYTRR